MNLDTETKTIEVVLGEAITTSQCDITASYADINASGNTFVLGEQSGVTNGTIPVTAVTAPNVPNTQRQVKELRVFNNDTVSHTVTVRLNDDVSIHIIQQGSLSPGATLLYTPEGGSLLVSTAVSGSPLTVTDGTHTIANTGTLSFTGATVGGTSPNATVTVTGGGGGTINVTRITMSSAQILASQGSPVFVLDFPGAGKALAVLVTYYECVFGTTPYTSGGNGGLQYGSGVNADAGDGGIFQIGQSQIVTSIGSFGLIAGVGSGSPVTLVEDSAIYYSNPSGYTGGDSTGVITVMWTAVTVVD